MIMVMNVATIPRNSHDSKVSWLKIELWKSKTSPASGVAGMESGHAPRKSVQVPGTPATHSFSPDLFVRSRVKARPRGAENVLATVKLPKVVSTVVKAGAVNPPWLEVAETNVPAAPLRIVAVGLAACHTSRMMGAARPSTSAEKNAMTAVRPRVDDRGADGAKSVCMFRFPPEELTFVEEFKEAQVNFGRRQISPIANFYCTLSQELRLHVGTVTDQLRYYIAQPRCAARVTERCAHVRL